MWSSIIRVAKIVALLGFVLPWFAISCAGRAIIEPRGYELALGIETKVSEDFTYRAQTPNLVQPAAFQTAQAPRAARGWSPHPVVQAMAAGAALALALSLIAGFFLRERLYQMISAGVGFAAAGVSFGAVYGVKLEFDRQIQSGEQGLDPAFAGMAGSMLQFSFAPGLWVTVIAAAVAGLIASILLAMAAQTSASQQSLQPRD